MQKTVTLLSIGCALLWSGCSVQQRTLMPGWHVERSSTNRPFQGVSREDRVAAPLPVASTAAEPDDVVAVRGDGEAWFESSLTPVIAWEPQGEIPPPPPMRLRVPAAVEAATISREVARPGSEVATTTIELDRDAELTLISLGAALLMLGYSPFSLLGYLIVFLASIVVTPLIHAVLWGETLNWASSRLGRIAVSLVLSGVLLTGMAALIGSVLGWVF